MKKITSTVKDEITFREAEGSLSKKEIITAIKDHTTTLSTSMVVWDFTNAYAKGISSSDLKEIADIAIEKNSHRPVSDKTAVIFASEPEMDLGRQVGKYLEANELHYKFKVFIDMHDALIWLYSDDEVS
jgi:hypothetical protein